VSETLDTILAEDYLGDLSSLPIDELRSRRNRCKEVETGLSYLRRMVQGRLDVVSAEMGRRTDSDGARAGLEGLIARLPELLAASTRSPGTGRLPQSIGTGDVDTDLAAELDDIISHSRLADVGDLADEELSSARDELAGFEQRVSGLRRALFDRIDAIENELTRRYRTGEASVDSLLD
jgi:hypothetical protein